MIFGDKVLISMDTEAAFINDPENRELVTVIATFNYSSKKIPPMIIYKGAYHLQKYFVPTMDSNILYAHPEFGFTNNHLGMTSAVCWGRQLDRFGSEAIQSLAFARNTMSTDSRSLRSIRWL